MLKFYFQHLSATQRAEFIKLYNERSRRRYNDDDRQFTIEGNGAGKMAIGYPGYFYRVPFFAEVTSR